MIKTKAPGKILLLGGYSVLERPNIALVLAVDAFVHATLKKRNDDKIVISIPQFKIKITTTTREIKTIGDERAKFVISAIKAAFYYFDYKKIAYFGFEITTKSDRAFSVNKGKSGLGSSAAVTVAAVKALFEAFVLSQPMAEIHTVAQSAHAAAQNKLGSGFDVAAACFGTIVYSRFSPSLFSFDNPALLDPRYAKLDCKITQFSFPISFHLVFANFPDKSMSTTNAVGQVFDFKKNNPDAYVALIRDIDAENRHALEALSQGDLVRFKNHVGHGRNHTKELGILSGVQIESDGMSSLIEETEKHGAFVAKLPGAGGFDSIVALCVAKGGAASVRKFWKQNGLGPIDLHII